MIIGIAGKFGSGKDSAADVLVNRFGFQRFSFAGPLRAECAFALSMCSAPDGAPEDIARILAGPRKPEEVYLKPTPADIRRLLQWWGEHRRAQKLDYWIWRLADQIDGIDSVVIPDVRYPNEAEFIRARGGQVWLIDRPARAEYGDPTLHQHISEKFCDSNYGWDCAIRNNGTLEQFQRKVRDVMRCHAELARLDAEIARGGHSAGERIGIEIGYVDWNSELRAILAERMI